MPKAEFDRPCVVWWKEAGIVWLSTSVLLIAFQIYLQNVHIETTNGLWKSIDVRRWMVDPGWHRIDFANVAYFPVQTLFCRCLEFIGVFPQQIWRQLAVLNGLAGGVGAAAVYIFVLRWFASRAVALLTTVLYAGSGFYLLLSVINEDIMPGAVLVLIATLLACASFSRPTAAGIAGVAVLFSLGWLWEWRLIFPTLPPMLLALFLAAGSWPQRVGRPLWFLVAMSFVPVGLSTIYWVSHHGGSPAATEFLIRLYWAGKGLGTGWGGFSAVKFVFSLIGMDESLVGGHNVATWGVWHANPWVVSELGFGTALLIGLLAVTIIYAWRRRRDSTVFTSTVMFSGTLAGGTVFNLYSQPQDPQMVINVMLWTIPAWALVANAILLAPTSSSVSRIWTMPATAMLTLAVLIPFAYNVSALAAQRGADPANMALVARLGTQFDPARTVFLYQGFEGITTWEAVIWGAAEAGGWYANCDLPPASGGDRTFKYFSATSALGLHPDWSAKAVADALMREIDCAMGLGYQMVAAPAYITPDPQWMSGFAALKNADTARTMRTMIETNYQLTPAFSDPVGGTYSIVLRRLKP